MPWISPPIQLGGSTSGDESRNPPEHEITATGCSAVIPAQAVRVKKGASDWRRWLTLTRVLSSAIAVGVTSMVSKGANLPIAVIVGGVAGSWSGLMQWKNRERLNWLANQGWLSFRPPEPHEKASLVRRYIKRSLQTGLNGTLMSVSYYITRLNSDLCTPHAGVRILTMIIESLYTQAAWEAMNQEWTEGAIRRNPEKAYLYKRLSGLGSLAQAVINVTANALNIGGIHAAGIHLGTLVSGTIGTVGTVLYVLRKYPAICVSIPEAEKP